MSEISSPKFKNFALMNLLNAEQELLKKALHFGLRMKSSPSTVAPHLAGLEVAHLNSVFDNLQNVSKILTICQDEKIDPWDDREFFRLGMRALSLTHPSDFLSHLNSGDCIEGYDMRRIQVFRNMRFMETCGYSLVEMLTYDWPTLFDRSQFITNMMINVSDKLLWEANRTIPFQIPKHFIRETRSGEGQVLEVEFKWMSPLFSGPDKPYGVLAVSSAQPIGHDLVNGNLAFV